MLIYLAAAYSRRLELRAYADQLRALGHEVTSSWLEEPPAGVTDDGVTITGPEEALAAIGDRDLHDIERCELFVAFSEPPGAWSRGTRHAELGAALAWGKRVWLVGEREHLFHWHRRVKVVPTWEAFKALMTETPRQRAARVRGAGWTLHPSIAQILDPYQERAREGVRDFDGLPAASFVALVAVMPEDRREMRFNGSPNTATYLDLCARFPGIEFFGRRSVPPSFEEIFVEGFYVPERDLSFGALKRLKALGPDEFGWEERRGERWIRLWWD